MVTFAHTYQQHLDFTRRDRRKELQERGWGWLAGLNKGCESMRSKGEKRLKEGAKQGEPILLKCLIKCLDYNLNRQVNTVGRKRKEKGELGGKKV